MAKKTCECCGKPKGDLEVKEWGRRLLLCGTCRKQGRAKVLARLEAREPGPSAVQEAPPAAQATGPAGPPVPEPEAQPAPEAAATDVEKPRRRRAKADGPKAPTVAGVVRELVAQGKTNAEIWAVIQPQFGLSDDKKWYPGWYRWNDKRKSEAAEGGER